MKFGTWRWWGRKPHAPAAFTPRKCSWYSFSLGVESTPGPWCGRKEICQLKNPVTPPGIDSGTVRLVAQRLNHYATPGPKSNEYQGYFVVGKGGRCVGFITLSPSCADCIDTDEPQPSWNPQGLYRDRFFTSAAEYRLVTLKSLQNYAKCHRCVDMCCN